MRNLGNKINARYLASQAGAAIVPASGPLPDSKNEIEQIADNGRFVFTQRWLLDNPYAEGDYFVAAFVDSTEIFEEFDEVNNFSFSENADVTIDLRPNLDLQNLTYRTAVILKMARSRCNSISSTSGLRISRSVKISKSP